jgi:hypothetical protein
MGNEVLKNGNGIEVMRDDFQFFHVLSILKYNFDPFLVSLVMIFVVNYIIHSTTCEQAYSGARNSGFSDYACPQVRCTAEYMLGFRYILHLTLSIYLKGKAQPLLPHGPHTRWLKMLILPINNVFLLTGISITRTGISNKNPIGTGILPKFQVGNGIGPPPPPPSGPSM